MIENPLAWAKKLLGWVRGEKHPNTPRIVFKNVCECDRVRRVLLSRCRICDFVVSRDALAVREISFRCDNKSCCITLNTKPHQVCNLCYDLFHSIYVNYGMKDMNYFKQIDEKNKADYDKFKRRDNNGGNW